MKNRPWGWVPSLYFAEGIPNAVVVTASVLMYKNLGVGNAQTALFTSLIYLAWVLKPLWSPFVDIFGTKRRWIVLMQWLLAVSFTGVAMLLNTPAYIWGTLLMLTLMAFVSATHDIAADGFYMLGLNQGQQSFFVGFRNVAYKLATVLVLSGGTAMSGLLIKGGSSAVFAWTVVMGGFGVIYVVLASWHHFMLPHPAADHGVPGRTAADIAKDLRATFRTFFVRPGLWGALAFMLLYRLPESLLTKMIIPFLIDPAEAGGLGLSNETVGITYGIVGTVGLLAGGLTGGIMISRFGLKRMLLPMATAMSLTCLTFVLLSMAAAPTQLLVDICVAVEQFGYGFGFSAYMLYLIYYSRGNYATAHYAFCTAFMAIGLMVPGLFAGALQELLGYQNFFLLTIVCCITTIAVSLIVKIDPEFGKKNKN